MALVVRKPAEPVHYKLYGCLTTRVSPAVSGHHAVDELHPNGDGGCGEAWLHSDDEAVSAVRHMNIGIRGHARVRVIPHI